MSFFSRMFGGGPAKEPEKEREPVDAPGLAQQQGERLQRLAARRLLLLQQAQVAAQVRRARELAAEFVSREDQEVL